jgi:DNA-binding CsgD family transcriptional regulator
MQLPERDVTHVRRAAYIHDLGNLGVSNAIWDQERALTDAERERLRLHPYLVDRMLARMTALRPVRQLAARHHERLDGSGYPGALGASALGMTDRLLAAADVYHAMTELRPHRPARTAEQAGKLLRAEVTAGRLDADAVHAVLSAAGHRSPAKRSGPAGLTSREVEVLGLVARGLSNRDVAKRLGISPKTVSNHVEHVYSQIGVTTRAAAALFAMQHGLVGGFEADG